MNFYKQTLYNRPKWIEYHKKWTASRHQPPYQCRKIQWLKHFTPEPPSGRCAPAEIFRVTADRKATTGTHRSQQQNSSLALDVQWTRHSAWVQSSRRSMSANGCRPMSAGWARAEEITTTKKNTHTNTQPEIASSRFWKVRLPTSYQRYLHWALRHSYNPKPQSTHPYHGADAA